MGTTEDLARFIAETQEEVPVTPNTPYTVTQMTTAWRGKYRASATVSTSCRQAVVSRGCPSVPGTTGGDRCFIPSSSCGHSLCSG